MREITDEILGKFDSTRHYAIENMADLNANHRKIADSNICFMERVKIANLRPVRSEKIARLDFDVTDLQGESVRGTFVYNSTQPKQEQEINSMRILTRSIYSQDSLVSIKFSPIKETYLGESRQRKILIYEAYDSGDYQLGYSQPMPLNPETTQTPDLVLA